MASETKKSKKSPEEIALLRAEAAKKKEEHKAKIALTGDLPEGKKISTQALKKAIKEEERAKTKDAKVIAASSSPAPSTTEVKYAELTDPKSTFELVHVRSVGKHIGKRVCLRGWVARMRMQGGSPMFVYVRDGTVFKIKHPEAKADDKLVTDVVQCVLTGKCSQTYDAKHMIRESYVEVYGTLVSAPKHEDRVEILVDYWRMLSPSHIDIEGRMAKSATIETRQIERALFLREDKSVYIAKALACLVEGTRAWCKEQKHTEVFPPQTSMMQVEGGATLMKLDYFGKEAYLTQSQQLYLELALRHLGEVYCIQNSFRGEKSRTRRHQAEFLHFEAELKRTFPELLTYIEQMIVFLSEWMLRHCKEILLTMNPKFKVPTLPFRRMTYIEAIDFCAEHDIKTTDPSNVPTVTPTVAVASQDEKKDDGEELKCEPRTLVYGDDIPEAIELKILSIVQEPIFLIRFETKKKAFYTRPCPDDPQYTESADLLYYGTGDLSSVGEAVGSGSRREKYDDLLAAIIKEGLDPKQYSWYLDTRKYGSVHTSGFGLGVQRLLMGMLGLPRIHETTIFPRTRDHCL